MFKRGMTAAVLVAAAGLIGGCANDGNLMGDSLTTASVAPGERIRLGGLVEKGTIVRGQGTNVSFSVTDGEKSVEVTYTGILPDLFREEQGVITEGTFASDGKFVADSVLAKHDESYMPREVAESLKEKGVWQPN